MAKRRRNRPPRPEGVAGDTTVAGVLRPKPLHLAYVIDSNGQPYETVSWVDDQVPYDIASLGLPAEEFNLD